MAVIVQKLGGTSMGSAERIQAVARHIDAAAKEGNHIVAVVSAMAGETNRLIDLAHQLSPSPNDAEFDVLMSTGEGVSCSLLAIALHALGRPAQTLLGFQVPILTDGNHTRARIRYIDPTLIRSLLDRGIVPIVPGFQGMSLAGRITTLGRGGSDTSAVAVAAAIEADKCEIYSDVDGILTADPRIVPSATTLPTLSSEELLEMSGAGAKVVQMRAVELAAQHGIPLHLRSSFDRDKEGTIVVPDDQYLEKTVVTSIAVTKNESKISIRKIPDRSGIAKALFEPIARANINVDMIVQTIHDDGFSDLAFTVTKEDLTRAMQLADAAAKMVSAGRVEAAGDVAKVSIVGVGMRSHAGVAATMFDVLGKEGINIQLISTSEIKVSVVIEMKYADVAVNALHQAFKLG